MSEQSPSAMYEGAKRLFLAICQWALLDIQKYRNKKGAGSRISNSMKNDYLESIYFFKYEFPTWMEVLNLEVDHRFKKILDFVNLENINVDPKTPYDREIKKFVCINPDCRKEFETKANHIHYCPECRKSQKRAYQKRYRDRMKVVRI